MKMSEPQRNKIENYLSSMLTSPRALQLTGLISQAVKSSNSLSVSLIEAGSWKAEPVLQFRHPSLLSRAHLFNFRTKGRLCRYGTELNMSAHAVRLKGVWQPEGKPFRAGSVYYSLVPAQKAKAIVIFFAGDNCEDSGDPVVERLSRPEEIAELLGSKLGTSTDIWIVYPSHYEGRFACYKQFLPCTTPSGEPLGYLPLGIPAFTQLFNLLHLVSDHVNTDVLANRSFSLSLKGEADNELRPVVQTIGESSLAHCPGSQARSSTPTDEVHSNAGVKVTLLGFSKGGVVVNQLLAEIAHFHSPEFHRNEPGSLKEAMKFVEGDVRDPGSQEDNNAAYQGSENKQSHLAPVEKRILSKVYPDPRFSRSATSSPFQERNTKSEAPRLTDEQLVSDRASQSGSQGFSEWGTLPGSVDHLLTRVRNVHFLDVGLNCRGAHLTDPQVLEQLVKASAHQMNGLQIRVYGTPRQWNDNRRPWIPLEKNEFVSLLREIKAGHEDAKLAVDEVYLFEDNCGTLRLHFEILEAVDMT